MSFTFRGGGTRKHKKATAYSEATYRTQDRGTNLVRPGPLYFSGVYLGDDPDPNIRFQILRDISGRLVAILTDGHRRIFRRFCSRLIFAV